MKRVVAALIGMGLGACAPPQQPVQAPPPVVDATPSPLPVNVESFVCPGNVPLDVAFQAMPDLATITVADETYKLPIAVSGSGYRYTDGKVEFTGKGDEVRLKRDDGSELVCARAPMTPPAP